MFQDSLAGIALQGINNFQHYVKKQKTLRDRIVEELTKEGWDVKFYSRATLFDDNKVIVKLRN